MKKYVKEIGKGESDGDSEFSDYADVSETDSTDSKDDSWVHVVDEKQFRQENKEKKALSDQGQLAATFGTAINKPAPPIRKYSLNLMGAPILTSKTSTNSKLGEKKLTESKNSREVLARIKEDVILLAKQFISSKGPFQSKVTAGLFAGQYNRPYRDFLEVFRKFETREHDSALAFQFLSAVQKLEKRGDLVKKLRQYIAVSNCFKLVHSVEAKSMR